MRKQIVLDRLVQVTSEDGYILTGCAFEPRDSAADATILWVHGTSLGFAEPEYVAIGRAVAARGLRFVSVETRGHNFGAWLRGPSGMKLAGSAWEFLSEAPMDIAPWRRYGRSLPGSALFLAGHGWGAAKIVYDLAQRGSDGVDGVVLASSGSLVRDQLDPSQAETAEQLVGADQGWQLLPWGTRPGMAPNTVSAQSYATRARTHRELYGAAGTPPALAQIDVPILAWFGDAEGREAGTTEAFFTSMRTNASQCPDFRTTMLKGGSFLYTGIEPIVAERLVNWCRRFGTETEAAGAGD